MRIGIIGRGTLGGAIARGLSTVDGWSVGSTTRATSAENRGLVEASDVVVVCVKPHDVEGVVREVAPLLTTDHVIVSTAATVGCEQLRAWTGERGRVVRAMPNMPIGACAAMTVLARERTTCNDALHTAQRLFDALGRTLVMDETKMDAVTAIGGCGPAFAFVIMEAMIDAAIALGIPYAQARELVGQTLYGSAKLLLAGNEHPAQLKIAVATPGGRTVRGLRELEEGALRATLMRAVFAAAV